MRKLPGTTIRFDCPRCGDEHHLVLPVDHADALGEHVLARVVHGEVIAPRTWWLVAS